MTPTATSVSTVLAHLAFTYLSPRFHLALGAGGAHGNLNELSAVTSALPPCLYYKLRWSFVHHGVLVEHVIHGGW